MNCKVSAVQFGVGADVAENLETCLRLIDAAAREAPDFIILPQLSNHCGFFQNAGETAEAALDANCDFLRRVAAKAKDHNTYIKINVTLKKLNDKPVISNLLFSPAGKLAGRADQQILFGTENEYFSPADKAGDIVATAFGKIGMCSGADVLMMETARLAALRGAQLLLVSSASFGLDEAILHTPVRAAENNIFVAAAGKVGPLTASDRMARTAADLQIGLDSLQGTGGSQIVGPTGDVLKRAGIAGEAVITVDIDLDEAGIVAAAQIRRPELYKEIARKPAIRNFRRGAKEVSVAICQSYNALRNVDAELIVFPELCFFKDGVVPDLKRGVEYSAQMVKLISSFVSGTNKHVATSIVEKNEDGFAHVGVLINRDGIVFRQAQIHPNPHFEAVDSLGGDLNTIDLRFGRLAIITGNDSRFPETFRLAAYRHADIAVCPCAVRERWETELGLPERAAENRMSIVAATRPNPALGVFGTSLIATIEPQLTLGTDWKPSTFKGNLNYPVISRASAAEEVFYGTVYLANSDNRMIATGTNLVDGRPFKLLRKLTLS